MSENLSMKTPSWLNPLEMQAHFQCSAWHLHSKIKKKIGFLPPQALALKCSVHLSETGRTDVWRHLGIPVCVRVSRSSFALLRQCPAPTPPSLHSSPALTHQGQGSTLPYPAHEWPNDQKFHLGGGPMKPQGFLRLSMSAAHLDSIVLLEFLSEHCWNPGAGSYVCFSISFLSFTPSSNCLFLEYFEYLNMEWI